MIRALVFSCAGDIRKQVSPSTTHIIVSDDAKWDSELSEHVKLVPHVMVVRAGWALKCINEKMLLDEKPYELHA
jgi:hypothetical protein